MTHQDIVGSPPLPLVWKRAALLGGTWASVEIVLGSFLHNLRIPFAGTVLCIIGILLLIAGHSVWNQRGILWRAGVICALMKSISPSAVILGPMVGIASEGLLMELLLLPTGRNVIAYIIGGAVVALLPIVQLIIGLLVQFGFDIVRLYEKTYSVFAQQLGITTFTAHHLVLVLVVVVALMGAGAAVIGIAVGKRVIDTRANERLPLRRTSSVLFDQPAGQIRFSRLLLLFHAAILVPGFLLLRDLPLWASALFLCCYAYGVIRRYPFLSKRTLQPNIWLQFALVAVASGLFLGSSFDWQWDGLLVGIRMVFRALFTMLVFASISVELRNPLVLEYFLRMRLGELAEALKISFGILPESIAVLSGERHILRHPLQTSARMLAFAVASVEEPAADAHTSVCIVTGNVGEGKTQFLELLSAELQRNNIRAGGFLAPVVYERDVREGYDLLDIRTRQRVILCRRENKDGAQHVGPFYFYREGLEFGRRALAADATDACSVIIMDEIGPLELRGNGWADVFREHLQSGKIVVVAMRSSLVERVRGYFGFTAAHVWYVQKDSPLAAAQIITALSNRRS